MSPGAPVPSATVRSAGTACTAGAVGSASSAAQPPRIVAVVLSGKRCSGKDFACARLVELLSAPQVGATVDVQRVAVSDGCKRSYARETPGVDEARLFSDREYKEEHREALIRHFREVDTRQPGAFLDAALEAVSEAPQGTQVQLLAFTDIRRNHEVAHLASLRASGALHDLWTVRVNASEAARRSRGWAPKPVDNMYTETELDDYADWAAVLDNSAGAGELDDMLRRMVVPLVLSDVHSCSSHVHHATCGCVPRDLQMPRPPKGAAVVKLVCGQGHRVACAAFVRTLRQWAERVGVVVEDLSGSCLSSAEVAARICRASCSEPGEREVHRIVVVDALYGALEVPQSCVWPRQFAAPTHIFALDDLHVADFGAYIRGEAPWRSHGDEELDRLAHTARSLRDYTVFQVLPATGDAGEAPVLWQRAVEFLAVDAWELLDTRRLTVMPKSTHRPIYHAYTARINQQFENPPFGGEAVRWQPQGVPVDVPAPGTCCHFDTIDTLFEQRRFAIQRHPPVEIGRLEDVASFMKGTESDEAMALRQRWNVQDMPIKFPGSEYRLPAECGEVCLEFVQKVADFVKGVSKMHDECYCYLTLTVGEVDPWKTQRRPGMHADGFKSYLTHPNCAEEVNELVFLSVSSLPPVSFNEGFDVLDLDPGHDDIWVHCSQRTTAPYDDTLEPFGIYFLDGFNLHAVQTNKSFESVRRAFVRLMYTTSVYDRLGNAHNPFFDYDWEMVPARTQMPPPFWERRNEELGMAPEQEQDEQLPEGWIVYSDGRRGPAPGWDANFRRGQADAAR